MSLNNTSNFKGMSKFHKYRVIKRSGLQEPVSFDKIIRRIDSLCGGLDPERIDPTEIALETIKKFKNEITTEQIDYLSADVCASRMVDHPDFNMLAARICISNLHKNTNKQKTMWDVAQQLYNTTDLDGNHNPLISDELYEIIKNNAEAIEKEIDYERDFLFDFFGIKTLERAYLLRVKDEHVQKSSLKERDSGEDKLRKTKGRVVERPQHMWMRVALGIHGDNLQEAFKTYHLMSTKHFTHATPTLFNAGTKNSQLSSCYLLYMNDSMHGIYSTALESAMISKFAGGIGISISSVRAKNSRIRGTNGESSGIIPMCRVFNETACYVNQGGKRKGSIAFYLEPWHGDLLDFIDLRKNTGEEKLRARDLFLALWIPDLFMKRVIEDGVWSFMCPDQCPGLTNTYGKEFEKLYTKYESEGKFMCQMKAQSVYSRILEAQLETGMPYVAFKDNANRLSNQKNIGVIKSSNLCCEIMEYTDDNETANCNLASISLPAFLNKEGVYDFDKLADVAGTITANLNKVIDRNFYPPVESLNPFSKKGTLEKTQRSNFRHRPIGIGVQGLADVFCKMGYAFGSPEANELNKHIHEAIYYGTMKMSCELAKRYGHYETFKGSPFSEGKFQFNLWGLTDADLSGHFDWETLRKEVMTHGTRNSLLTALMPTASTSQILGNNETMEPYTSNLYTRSTLAGEYIVINRHLVNDLIKLGLWTEDMIAKIKYYGGSVQNIKEIPENIKRVYLTAYEMPQKWIVDQAISRGPFVDQSQSMNMFFEEPDSARLGNALMHGWKNNLKTGLYYLRSKPVVDPIQFGLDFEVIQRIRNEERKTLEGIEVEDSDEEDVDLRASDSSIEKEDDEERPKEAVCQFRPGMAPDDCEVCGA